MAGSAKVVAAARENGQLGGRPVKALIEMKKRARERATRLLCREQEESVRFLIYMRDNPNVSAPERIRCALEILSRGETPTKNASYLGTAAAGGELLDEPPKLVVLGRFKTDEPHTSEGNGHGPNGNGEPA